MKWAKTSWTYSNTMTNRKNIILKHIKDTLRMVGYTYLDSEYFAGYLYVQVLQYPIILSLFIQMLIKSNSL